MELREMTGTEYTVYYAIESYTPNGKRCLWDQASEDWVTESRISDDDVFTNLGSEKSYAEYVLREAMQRQFQMTTPKLITYEMGDK